MPIDNVTSNKRRKASTRDSVTTRRALSCTECKRRRTRCSSIGQTPCEACIQRKRPEACIWENHTNGASAGVQFSPPQNIAEDVAQLRAEVAKLKSVLDKHITAVSCNNATQGGSSSDPSASSMTTPGRPPTDMITAGDPHDLVESAITDLEVSIAGPYAGSRPVVTSAIGTVTVISEIYFGSLSGLEPGSLAGGWLLDTWFNGQVHRSWPAIERSTFMSQYDALSLLPLNHQSAVVPPAWLAEYTMILALAMKLGNHDSLISFLPSQSRNNIQHLSAELYRCSLRALDAADYLIMPQMRHIQVSLLYVLYHFHLGEAREQVNLAYRHLDSAITTAQWLDLDEIDENWTAPLDDPALSRLAPWASIELCKRLYHMLSFTDATIVRKKQWRRLGNHFGVSKTPLPGNYSETDLLCPTPPAERPLDEVTGASLARFGSQFGTLLSKYADNRTYDLEQKSQFDMESRGLLGRIPWSLEEVYDGKESEIGASWMMPHLYCSVLNRLIRNQRVQIEQDWSHSSSLNFRNTSIDSAVALIKVQDTCSRRRYIRPSFLQRWILRAVFVLAVNEVVQPWKAQRFFAGSGNSCRHRADIVTAIEIYRRPTPFDGDPKTTEACAKATQAVLETLDERQGGEETLQNADGQLKAFFENVHQKLNRIHDSSAYITGPRIVPATEFSDFDWSLWLTELDGTGNYSSNFLNL